TLPDSTTSVPPLRAAISRHRAPGDSTTVWPADTTTEPRLTLRGSETWTIVPPLATVPTALPPSTITSVAPSIRTVLLATAPDDTISMAFAERTVPMAIPPDDMVSTLLPIRTVSTVAPPASTDAIAPHL